MGYREEEKGEKWKQKEKRLINRPGACRTGSQTARVPATVSRSKGHRFFDLWSRKMPQSS